MKNLLMRSTRALGAALLLAAPRAAAQQTDPTVVLIVSDGLRWQEVFTGADPSLLDGAHGGIWEDSVQLRRQFWSDDVAERRRMLLPFIWTVVAKEGQIFGDQTQGSVARVTNGFSFSYPGYSEMLTGRPDSQINSNAFGPNPDTTVLEWLNGRPAYRDRVAVFATWGIFKDIVNEPRSHLTLQSGWDRPRASGNAARDTLLDVLFRTTTRLEDDDLTNSLLQPVLLDYVRTGKPRVLFVGYGETDNWAHSGRYDLVLESARQFDAFVRQLWETMQSMPQYRGKTTFIITTDHGRGSGLEDWKHHGAEYPGAENVWIAVLGPRTPALGALAKVAPVTQSQIAATVAALLGEDWRKISPRAAAPLPVIGPAPRR